MSVRVHAASFVASKTQFLQYLWEARSRRGFVHHILEDEVDGQKEEQGDQRDEIKKK